MYLRMGGKIANRKMIDQVLIKSLKPWTQQFLCFKGKYFMREMIIEVEGDDLSIENQLSR